MGLQILSQKVEKNKTKTLTFGRIEVVSSRHRGQKHRKISHQLSQERTEEPSAQCPESAVSEWDGRGEEGQSDMVA